MFISLPFCLCCKMTEHTNSNLPFELEIVLSIGEKLSHHLNLNYFWTQESAASHIPAGFLLASCKLLVNRWLTAG